MIHLDMRMINARRSLWFPLPLLQAKVTVLPLKAVGARVGVELEVEGVGVDVKGDGVEVEAKVRCLLLIVYLYESGGCGMLSPISRDN
jgi:hypothetical protein